MRLTSSQFKKTHHHAAPRSLKTTKQNKVRANKVTPPRPPMQTAPPTRIFHSKKSVKTTKTTKKAQATSHTPPIPPKPTPHSEVSMMNPMLPLFNKYHQKDN
mmetsp:Transcript_33514/g.45910  ORF Transcript_33514/g.45910 Transcript_33514/m.45910 type:complete len:102 (-) Transcript_33514:1783-2088(-)